MYFVALSFVLLTNITFAEVGKISKTTGGSDAYVMRGSEKKNITADLKLEVGDELFSQKSIILIHLYPTTQLSLAKNTQIKITKSLIDETGAKDTSFSVINFFKGMVRVLVTKEENLEVDQRIQADGVTFVIRGTEFIISKDNEDYDLDVSEGEVEVSSPYVQTFVPEIVKAREGFKFNKKARQFERRKFERKFKDAPAFAGKNELRKNWKQKRKLKKAVRLPKPQSMVKK